MDFSVEHSAHHPDKSRGGRRIHVDMLEHAVAGDRFDYGAVLLAGHIIRAGDGPAGR